MSVKAQKIYPPHPLPTRGIGFFIGYSEKLNRLAYCYDTLVWQRGVDDIFDTSIYAQHKAKTTVASYSPTTLFIASADDQGNVRVWSPTHADLLTSLDTRPIAGPIFDLSWTEDNERLAYVGSGSNSFGGAINAKTGASVGEVMGHTQTTRSCAMKKQRPFRLVTAGDDMKHVFYRGPPFKFDHTSCHHDKFISCVRFAPDGSVYATAGLDGRIAIYQGENGQFVVVHQIGSGICAIDFSPDSKQILAGQMDGRVVIINVSDGAVVAEWAIGSEIFQQQAGVLWTKRNKISISLNGDFNFLGDRGAFTIDRGHTGSVNAVAPLPGGFVSGDANGTVLFWHYGAKPYAVFGSDGGIGVLPGIRGIAVTSDGNVAVGRADGHILILNPADGSQVASYVAGQKQTGKLVAGKGFIATYTEKNLVIVTGGQVKTIPLSYVPLTIALAPDGAEIAVGGADKIVHLYNVSGAPKGEIPGLFKEVSAVAYSPDGNKIAATSEGKEISVWNRANIASPIIDGEMRMHSLAVTNILWLPDNVGFVTVSKDRSIRVWSSAFKRKAYELPRAHEGQINDAFWVDPQTLLTAGQDGSVRTWTVAGIQ